jgi:hypothetical protein
MVDLVPGLADMRLLRAWSGVIGISADGAPILDLLDDPRGLVLATGFGGNGFVTGPAVGQVVTDVVCRGHSELLTPRLRLSRFENDPAAREPFEDWLRSPVHAHETEAWAVTIPESARPPATRPLAARPRPARS